VQTRRITAQADPVTQESVLAYESGFKAQFLDHKAQLTGAAFYYDYSHRQLLGSINLGPPFGTLPGMVSRPKSRVVAHSGRVRPVRFNIQMEISL